ncbi:hypothetical protein [Terasakiella brassicae]|uniref:hypothetical protein n=1 Tax=Terasakiella brassicae TaxID=1634917 RepID=UPI001669993E|nr:hypothetical protein [Terasakiella brassicae]
MVDFEVPDFFDPANATNVNFSPSLPTIFQYANEHLKTNDIQQSYADKSRIELLLIDCQKDLCFSPYFDSPEQPRGDNAVRIAKFIYKNLPCISYITSLMRSHFPYQIFSPLWWVNANGEHVGDMTTISSADLRSGKYRPAPEVSQFASGRYSWASRQVEHYITSLEGKGYQLCVKPFHCLMGSDGWNMVGIIQEAFWFHCVTRSTQPNLQIYENNPWIECHSAFGSDCLTRWDGKGCLDQKDTALMLRLLQNDCLFIAGYSAFHPITATIDDLLRQIMITDPALAKKVYLLTDCMVPVATSDTNIQEVYERYSDAGINLVSSTETINLNEYRFK